MNSSMERITFIPRGYVEAVAETPERVIDLVEGAGLVQLTVPDAGCYRIRASMPMGVLSTESPFVCGDDWMSAEGGSPERVEVSVHPVPWADPASWWNDLRKLGLSLPPPAHLRAGVAA